MQLHYQLEAERFAPSVLVNNVHDVFPGNIRARAHTVTSPLGDT